MLSSILAIVFVHRAEIPTDMLLNTIDCFLTKALQDLNCFLEFGKVLFP